MQEAQQGITAADFLASPMIVLFVVLMALVTVKKLKPDFKPKVSKPVFIFMCLGLMAIMLTIVFKQIVIHGYK